MSRPTMPTMIMDRESHIARITLHAPRLDSASARALCGFLDEVEADDDVKVVVISPEGRDLSLGWDIQDSWRMYVDAPGGAIKKVPSQRARLIAQDELWWGPRGLYSRVLHCRKVTVLAARGQCLETGLFLTLCCDLVLAAADARFGNPRWTLLGVDGDVSLLIASVGLKRAKELMYCGTAWTAEAAQRYGLVDRAVATDELAGEIDVLAGICASIMRDGIVTEKYAVFASLEKMGVGMAFAAATVVAGSLSNIHFQPGETNVLREVREGGTDALLDGWNRNLTPTEDLA